MSHRKLFAWALFIALAGLLFLSLNKTPTQYAPIALSDFVNRLENDRVKEVAVLNDSLVGEFRELEPVGRNGEKVGKFRVDLPTGTTSNWLFTEWLVQHRQNARVLAERQNDVLLQFVLPLVPWLLIFAFIWFFVFRQLRGFQSKSREPMQVLLVNPPAGSGMAPPPLPPQTPPAPPTGML